MPFRLRSLFLSPACRGSAARQYHLRNVPLRQFPRAKVVLGAGVCAASVFALSRLVLTDVNESADSDNDGEDSDIRKAPLTSLLRSYFVFSVCSVPALVDWSPHIISFMTSVPGLKQFAEALVRRSFFAQFVGGDTVADCIPVVRRLRSEFKGSLLVYSVEAQETNTGINGNALHGQMVEEIIRSIDTAADHEDSLSTTTERSTWVAIKLSALLPDSQAFVRLSQHLVQSRSTSSIPFPGCPTARDLDILAAPEKSPFLSSADRAALLNLRTDLFRICKRAKERQVKVLIDAEYSWYQPAVDAYTILLSRTFNALSIDSFVQPIVYGTYQAYLRRGPSHLLQSLKDAENGNYALGVKLVRGAYHDQELASGSRTPASPGESPPVYLTKAETDTSFNQCAKTLVDRISLDIQHGSRPRISVIFGTHNTESCRFVISLLEQEGLAKQGTSRGTVCISRSTALRIAFGQLFGMRDILTNYLTARIESPTPVVFKYIPYGKLSEVMPYLSRRAIENKSVLENGATLAELRRIGSEIRRRLHFNS